LSFLGDLRIEGENIEDEKISFGVDIENKERINWLKFRTVEEKDFDLVISIVINGEKHDAMFEKDEVENAAEKVEESQAEEKSLEENEVEENKIIGKPVEKKSEVTKEQIPDIVQEVKLEIRNQQKPKIENDFSDIDLNDPASEIAAIKIQVRKINSKKNSKWTLELF
jgi:GTPase SAR1 family protein